MKKYLVALVILLAAAGAYVVITTQSKTAKVEPPQTSQNLATTTAVGNFNFAPAAHSSQPAELTIYVPKDVAAYNKKVTDYVNNHDPKDVITNADLLAKKVLVTLAPPYDVVRGSAELAAEQIQTQTVIKIVDFRVENGAAYVTFNIDLDGWAGVSYAIYKVRPVVQATLLEFPQIKRVVFYGEKDFESAGAILFSQLGVKMNLVPGLVWSEGNSSTAYFSLDSLEAISNTQTGIGCQRTSGPAGALTRVNKSELRPNDFYLYDQNYLTEAVGKGLAKEFPTFYLVYVSPQSYCGSANKQADDAKYDLSNELKQLRVDILQALQSAQEE